MQMDNNDSDFSPALITLRRSLTDATPPQCKLCIVTLLRIIDNILADSNTSDEEKKNGRIRKIKINGPFHDRAGQWEGSIDFLFECGFEKTTTTQLKLSDEVPHRLLLARNALARLAVERLDLLDNTLPDCPAVEVVDSDKSKTNSDIISGHETNSTRGDPIILCSSIKLTNEVVDETMATVSELCEATMVYSQNESIPECQPDDPLPSISSTDSMSCLLDEIEKELTSGDSSFSFDACTSRSENVHDRFPKQKEEGEELLSSSFTHDRVLGVEEVSSRESVFFASSISFDDFMLEGPSIQKELTLTEDDVCNLVKVKQTNHVGDQEYEHIFSTKVSDENDKVKMAPICSDQADLELPEMIEELLLYESPTEIASSQSIEEGIITGETLDNDFATLQLSTNDHETAVIIHYHGRNDSVSDLLVDLESKEKQKMTGLDTTELSPLIQTEEYQIREKVEDAKELLECDSLSIDCVNSMSPSPKEHINRQNTSLSFSQSISPLDATNHTEYSQLFSRIPHPDGEFTSGSDNHYMIQYRLGFELCHRALFSIWFCETIQDKRTSSQQLNYVDHCIGLTNLNLFERIRNVEVESNAEEQPSLTNRSSRRPILLVPLDIAYAVWAHILQLKSESDIYSDGRKISQDGSTAGKMYSWIVSNNPRLQEIDDNVHPARELFVLNHDDSSIFDICNFICKVLRDNDLISLYRADVVGCLSDNIYVYVGVEERFECEEKEVMSTNRCGSMPKLEDEMLLGECHALLSRLIYPRILHELQLFDENDEHGNIIRNGVICWYCSQYAVKHLIESGQLVTAKTLLLDERFIRLRVQYLGYLAGTSAHCHDCARLAFFVSQKQTNDMHSKNCNDESNNVFSYDCAEQNMKPVDNQDVESSNWCRDRFKILYSLSTVLRGKVAGGDLSSEENETKRCIGQAMKVIGENISIIGPYSVQEMEHYEESFRLLCEAHGENHNHKSIADILFTMSYHHQRFNRYTFAQKCYEQSLRIYKVTVGCDHPCVAKILHNVGIIYHALEKNVVALKCFHKSLSIRLSQIGEKLSVAESYCWLGKIYREEKKLTKAHEYFVAAHQIKVELLGAEHLESAEILLNIGIVCDELGLRDQSLSCFRKVLFIRLATVTGINDHCGNKAVCETLDCIANVYWAKGEFHKALQFFEQCLKRRKRIVHIPSSDKDEVALLLRTYQDVITLIRAQETEGTTHTGKSMKVGLLFLEVGKLFDQYFNKHTRALNYLQKALQIFKLEKDYKRIANALFSIGCVHVKKSAYVKALKCFDDSLVMQKMCSHSKETAEFADLMHNIGNCNAKMGYFEKSLSAFEEAMRIKQNFYPETHLSLSKTQHCLGLVMLQLGNLDRAHDLFQCSLESRRTLLGSDHLDVSFSFHSLGKIYFFKNKIDNAINCMEEALKIKKAKLPDNHISLAETMHVLGSLYIMKETYAAAISLLNSALVAYRGKRDCEIMKSDVLDLLGSAYTKIGDIDDAILSYEHSLKIKKSIVGERAIPCANVLMEIGRLKSLKLDNDGALSVFKEVKTIHKDVYAKNHLKNADLLIEVGLIQERLHNDDLAFRCFVEALRVRRKLLHGTHRDVASAIVCVGRIHQSQSDHVKAIALFKEAIMIYQEGDGDHVSNEWDCASHHLGLSQTSIGDIDNAISSLDFCLNRRGRVFGVESKEWAEAAYSLGLAKSEAGLCDDAISLFEKFVSIQKTFEDSDLKKSANALMTIGEIYVNKNEVDHAMARFNEALTITKQTNDDQGSSEALLQVGNLHEAKNQYTESLMCYEESLTLRMSSVGEDEITADTVSRIGELHRIRGHYEVAAEKFSLALDMYKCAIGETNLSVAQTYHSLGYACDGMNDVSKAMQNHKEGLSIRKRILGGDHLLIASSLDDVAGMYQKQNEHEKALKCLKEALRLRRIHLLDDDIEISKTLFGMGIVFAAVNDSENAAECYKTSLEISSRIGSHPKLEAQTLHQIGCLEAAKCNYREALHNWRTCLSKYRESGLRDDHYMVACTLGNIEMAENVLTM